MKKILLIFLCVYSVSAAAFDIVKPDTEQELIRDSDIDNVSRNIGVYGGLINHENFNSSFITALYFSYPFDEDVFVEAEYGISVINDTEYRNIGLPLLSQEELSVQFYTILVGYNILPGEVYWSREKTLVSRFYLIAGVGAVSFDDADYVSIQFGAGIKMELDKNKSIRFEARNRMYDTDVLGTDKLTNNIEFHLGVDWGF
ncbi:MAG: outer membrane beta-barrel domain-containing protein [Gammaproteobacteria bacterium]|nr:outer membrane beta-barrel domain-containing protein [Gammaproteobacteria bacterium]